MRVRVVAVGRTRTRWVKDGLADYLGRLRGRWAVEWCDVRAADGDDPASVRRREAPRVLAAIPDGDPFIALLVEGRALSSEGLARVLDEHALAGHRSLTFVIGGSFGLDDEVARRARDRLSLSRMTFPHQVVRVLLAEQLYRAVSILEGSPYHHGA